jgi:hypothetical protein
MASVTRGCLSIPLLRGLACVLAGTALACGDALVDESYSGTALFLAEGQVMGTSESVDVEHPEVTLSVFWYRRGARPGEETLVEQPGAAMRAEYYRPFKLKLFDEPGAEHLRTAPSGARYGVAVVAAYPDVNGNKRRDVSEPIIGSGTGRALIRAPTALSAADSPTGAPLPPGWHIVSTPLTCAATPNLSSGGGPTEPGPVMSAVCNVPLGEPCKNDVECGDGVCVRDFLGHWPGSACLLPEHPANGCRPQGAVLARDPGNSASAYWLKACQKTEDCGRVAPFQCDQQLRACKPTANFPVELNDRAPPGNFCVPQSNTPPPPPP